MGGEDNVEVAADPIVDLSDPNIVLFLLEGVIDRLYDGRERRGVFASSGRRRATVVSRMP